MHSKKLKLSRVNLIAFVMLFLFLGNSANAQEPIIFGELTPLSPPGTYAIGTECKWGALLAEKKVNEQGGVLGRKIKVITGDTRGMPEEGQAAAERLVTRDGAVVLFGHNHSSVAKVGIEVAHKYKVPHILTGPWADFLTEKSYPEVFRIGLCNSIIYKDFVPQFIKEAGFKHIAVITEMSDWALGVQDKLKTAFTELGLDHEIYSMPRETRDFKIQILKMKDRKPKFDLYISLIVSAGEYVLTKQAYELKFAPTPETAHLAGASEPLEPEFWEIAGEAGVYELVVFESVPPALSTPTLKEFEKTYEEVYKRRPSPVAYHEYDTVMLLAEAIKKAGTTDSDKLIKTLENIEYEGLFGKYFFPSNPELKGTYKYHQWPNHPLLLIQYTEKNQHAADSPIVYPRKWATVDWYFKKPPK
jgi:ABC-type branched-subunit amino acid transport system substrate-binding protein